MVSGPAVINLFTVLVGGAAVHVHCYQDLLSTNNGMNFAVANGTIT